jgi:hypothetical protein
LSHIFNVKDYLRPNMSLGYETEQLSTLDCNIPPVEARAGTAFPRGFTRAQPVGNPEEKLFLPYWTVAITHLKLENPS